MTRKSRGARLLGRTLQMPAAFDRDGMRWMLQAVSPATVIVLVHRGRRSGRVFKTPLDALVEHRERGELIVGPMWGKDADWYRNVVAGGLIEIHVRGETWQVEWEELDEAGRRVEVGAFRKGHPVYSRLILRMLARVNGFEGDPAEAVIRELPALRLRRVMS